jgi:hypothetical protein
MSHQRLLHRGSPAEDGEGHRRELGAPACIVGKKGVGPIGLSSRVSGRPLAMEFRGVCLV